MLSNGWVSLWLVLTFSATFFELPVSGVSGIVFKNCTRLVANKIDKKCIRGAIISVAVSFS